MPAAFTAVAGLVARYRRQRPLRGGSLIVTIFGDSILPRGGAVTLGSLITLTAPLGLKERLVRTAAARLAQAGWLEARRAAKRSEYRLSHDGRERFAEATRRIYGDPMTEWSGRWTVIILPNMRASDKRDLKQELIWRGFGELSTNVFAHPEHSPHSLGVRGTSAQLLSQVIVFDADLAGDGYPQRLANLGWDLKELGLRYRRFVKRFEPVEAALRDSRGLEPQTCFLVRTLLIHEYRRLHLRDPLLPARLLPPRWPGARAAALCRDIYARVFAPSEVHLSTVASRFDGPLPPADAPARQRFGGAARIVNLRPQATLPGSPRLNSGTHSPGRRRAPGGRS